MRFVSLIRKRLRLLFDFLPSNPPLGQRPRTLLKKLSFPVAFRPQMASLQMRT
jgi:hypothetical protein